MQGGDAYGMELSRLAVTGPPSADDVVRLVPDDDSHGGIDQLPRRAEQRAETPAVPALGRDNELLTRGVRPDSERTKTQSMRNNLISITDASARRRDTRANPNVAELRALFTAACRFGLTRAERDEWQARFDKAIAALEAQITASEDELSVEPRDTVAVR
jgi:hypothetical protein